jgi:hypothetical protein
MIINTYIHGYGSRFAEVSEITNTATLIKCSDDTLGAGGVPIFSDGITALVLDQDIHSLTSGATGSMKSRRVIMELIAS